MNRLREIFNNVIHSSDKWAPYFDVYDRHLSRFVGQPVTLVEIGVQKGGSLEMWSNYLGPQATIIGIDIDESCRHHMYDQENIKVVIGDQGNPEFWDNFLREHPTIDILIDDGGHTMIQQMVTLYKVFPILSAPGIFICEDCHTSYMKGIVLNNKTFIEHSKDCIDALHQRWFETQMPDIDDKISLVKNLTSIHYYDSVVIFEKFGEANMQRVAPSKFEPYRIY